MAGVSTAVTAGVGAQFGGAEALSSSVGTRALQLAGRAMVSSTITQGIAVATGLQPRFSWANVGTAGLGAAVGSAVGGSMFQEKEGFGWDLARGFAAGTAGGVTASVLIGGKADYAQVALDAFGNALGNSITAAAERSHLTARTNGVLRSAGYDPEKLGSSGKDKLLFDVAKGLLKKDFAAQDIATFIADPRIRDGLIGGSAQASEALAGMNLDEIAAYRAKSIETGDALLDFGTLAPVTVVAPPEWTLTFSDNVLKPMMAGASALGEFAKKNETMATLAATGLQLAMMGPAKLIQTTIVDQVKERTIGEYTEQVNEYIHEKATSFLEDQWQFSHDEASFLATSVMFAGQLVMDSAKNALGTARKINGMMNATAPSSVSKLTVNGETAATVTGKSVHTELAEARRKSSEFDLVNSPFTDSAGNVIQVPRRVDLNSGKPVTTSGSQASRPDAVKFESGLILDDKPLGRPIAKDRQEIIRFIDAYRESNGTQPRTIAIQRYDPKTGLPVVTELYNPTEFMPWKK